MSEVYLITPDERAYLQDAGDRMPLGVLYLSIALEEAGIRHRVYDMNHDSRHEIIRGIKKEKPDAVGLSILTPSYNQMRQFAMDIQGYTGKIIAGGFHVTNMPGSLDDVVDVEVYGYGEEAIIEALNTEAKHLKVEIDIDKYPIPNRKKLDKRRYNYTLDGMRAATMMVQRGCPYNCSFCSNFDKQPKRREIEGIREEVRQLKEEGYEAVYFLDDSFTLNRTFAAYVGLIMRDHGLKYRIEARATHLDEELVKHLAETGCTTVGIGIESGDNGVLEKARKGQTTEQVVEALQRLRRYHIKAKGFFIFGLPGETLESMTRTLIFADRLKREGLLSFADFYPLTVFPGSPIWKNPEKFGIEINDRNFEDYYSGARQERQRITCHPRGLKNELIEHFVKLGRSRWRN